MQTNSTYKITPVQRRKIEWQNLSFSSVSEVKIAQALDRVGVLFFPNCRGRLTTTQGRQNRECDFLVCYEGIWGILEVDGEPFHPPSRAAQDHKRDGFFLDHGVFVHRFDSDECFKYPDNVVRRFLERLKRSHETQPQTFSCSVALSTLSPGKLVFSQLSLHSRS